MGMKGFIIMMSLLSVALTTVAQDRWTIQSEYLDCDVPAFVFKPKNYDTGQEYPLVYLLHGYSADYTQWSKTIDCQDLANKYNTIIVCPEGFTSFYINGYDGKFQYESFFFEELVPKIHEELNIDVRNIFISGLSMGGYGALRYLIMHPGYFNSAGATSGALVIDFQQSRRMSQLFWGNNRLNDDLNRLLGNKDTTDWNRNSIVNLLRDNPDFNKPFIFDCGTEDVLYTANLELKSVVDSMKIPTAFISQPGSHNTDYWNKSIEHHFVFFDQMINRNRTRINSDDK